MPSRPDQLNPSRLQTAATAMAASAVLLPLSLGKLLELALKAVNPDDVDVTAGLAYLRPLLITSVCLLIVWLSAVVAIIVVLQRRESPVAARTPWMVLGVQVALGVLLFATQVTLSTVINPQ